MIRNLLAFGICLSLSTTFAQYRSIFNTDKSPLEINSFHVVGISGYPTTSTLFWYGKDTIIDNLNLPFDTIIDGNQQFIMYGPDWGNYKWFYKEDTLTGTLWAYGPTNYSSTPDSILLMDLSLSVGDTLFMQLPLWWFGSTEGYVCDSVFYKNGHKHQRFKTNQLNQISHISHTHFFVIEGIGNTMLMSTFYGDQPFDVVLCVSNRDTLLYMDSIHKTCENPWISVDQFQQANNAWKAYPNPTSGQFTLSCSNDQWIGAEWSLYSLHGQCLSKGIIAQHKDLQLSLEKVPSGVYVWRISNAVNVEQIRVVRL